MFLTFVLLHFQQYSASVTHTAIIMGDSSDVDQVILATGSYDHTIRLWQAHSGLCSKTMQHPDSVSFILWNVLFAS